MRKVRVKILKNIFNLIGIGKDIAPTKNQWRRFKRQMRNEKV